MQNHGKTPENLPASPAGQQDDFYEFKIEGYLSPTWSDWFDGLTLTNLENGQSVLCGPVRDQAALHSILARIRDLNLKLLLVRKM